ncbi:aminoglycoside phosphotransferase family protein [Sphingomonas naphthae]|uniref:Aminoglycoside phosphotransferase family protein n=1 Tax=Sphingomonas naphthae TaxID=1813468 RepID=A0ABY7TMV6_9SPHN|nr:aminoglycoside phosphotransferase family protein [Sphingomonas naphthae]WCT74567.1 aminoglycoside phosphotransferase family protein [Sphingomonas naphthae]
MRDDGPGTPIGRGTSSEVYRRADGRVVKLYGTEVPDALIAREEAASRHAAACGLPVAAASARIEVDGRRGLLFDYVEGRTVLAVTGRAPWGIARAFARMARAQAAIHSRRPPRDMRRQRDVTELQIVHSGCDMATRSAALARLTRLGASGGIDRLCHGDFHPGNVIDTPAGLVVIDWGRASAGQPLADLARTELLIRFGAFPSGNALRRGAVALCRELAARWYVWCYARAAGISPAAVAPWRLPMAVAWSRGLRSTRDDAFAAFVAREVAAAEAPAVERRPGWRTALLRARWQATLGVSILLLGCDPGFAFG